MRTTQLNVRVDPEIKNKASVILKTIGMNTSEAINIFLRRIIMEHGIPFDMRIPNEETIQAMEDIEHNRNLTKCDSVEDMWEKIGVSVEE
ncbi:MAG: type II toxin-antitoxin system RelB/DinJ family antitoxin [Candidatus Marinimicrobia bacterium]|nr:type II toxin-antitoxin system RelB/DinJ family antitoxin [Candidatus Neomarinimicrobiota bacterium]MCH8069200.1 type II toxin-antitoxin system RelB/DinJ family antitoxin [Candidatus Neomarinimicrobiota bacterium]